MELKLGDDEMGEEGSLVQLPN